MELERATLFPFSDFLEALRLIPFFEDGPLPTTFHEMSEDVSPGWFNRTEGAKHAYYQKGFEGAELSSFVAVRISLCFDIECAVAACVQSPVVDILHSNDKQAQTRIVTQTSKSSKMLT